MSRKKRGASRKLLFVFLGLGAAVAGGLGIWITGDVSRADKEAEAAAKDLPVLPAGPLQFVMANSNEATYLALDTVRRADSQITATVLKVGRTTTSIEGGGALVSATATVDCAADRIFDGKVGAFDVDGKLVSASTGFSGKRGRVVEPSDYQVPALCRGEKGRVVPDLHTAQRESQALPDAVAARAEADAKDAEAWAWLCAAGARDRWRAQTPADCAQALELRPADAATRLDRAYIFLKTGYNAEAAADIAKVLAAEPKNATALYARSLLTGIQRRGVAGVSASRADRCAALALEHDVANWAARTYQIQMSREFRICGPG